MPINEQTLTDARDDRSNHGVYAQNGMATEKVSNTQN